MSLVKMSLQDASFLRLESPTTPMHIGFLLTFKLPPKAPRDYMQKLHEKMQRFAVDSPPFNYRLAPAKKKLELPQWEVVDKVDLEYHLRHEALPAPGTERELGLVMSRLHSVPLDPSRPMWELYFIEGLQGGRFGLYLKIHHSLADGMLLMERLTRTLADSPRGKNLPPWALPPQTEDKERPVDEAGDAWRKWLEGLFKSAKDKKDKKPAGKMEGPRCLLNGPITGRRRFATQSIDLNRVKAIGKAADATVNDVVMAVCSGALRRFLDEVDSIPDQPLLVSVPVALPRGKDEVTGNSVGGINTQLASHLADPRQRLASIRQSMREAKVELQQQPTELTRAINSFGMYIMSLVPMGASDRAPFTNVTVSNVPGPRTKLYLDGAEMDGMYPVSVLAGDHRVNITLIGYCDQLFFGITGCPDKLPHMQRLAVLVPEALDELEAAYGLRAKRSARRPAARARARAAA